MTRISLLVLGTLIIGFVNSAQADHPCVHQSISFSYEARKAVASYTVGSSSCEVRAGSVSIWLRLSRNANTGPSPTDVLGARTCEWGRSCSVFVAIGHPAVDWAEYEGHGEYEENGLQGEVNAGAIGLRTTCIAAAGIGICGPP